MTHVSYKEPHITFRKPNGQLTLISSIMIFLLCLTVDNELIYTNVLLCF